MSAELVNTIATIVGIIVAAMGAFLFAFWIAMGIWTFNDIRARTSDWLAILLACVLVLVFPIVGWVLYMLIRPKQSLVDVYDRALEEEALPREIEETLACSACGVPVKENWVYCPQCHNQLQHTCPSCGNLARNEWDICVYCGTSQQVAAPRRFAGNPLRASNPLETPPLEETEDGLPYRPRALLLAIPETAYSALPPERQGEAWRLDGRLV